MSETRVSEVTLLERRAIAALRVAGISKDRACIEPWGAREACLDGRFTAAELRKIADVMDALAREPR